MKVEIQWTHSGIGISGFEIEANAKYDVPDPTARSFQFDADPGNYVAKMRAYLTTPDGKLYSAYSNEMPFTVPAVVESAVITKVRIVLEI